MVHRRGGREGEEGRVVSWQQFVRVTNLQQVKVRGKGTVVGSCCHYKYDMHYGQSQAQKCRRPDQVREGIKERETEREREGVVATCCHTNLCIPKLGEKNKTSTLLPLLAACLQVCKA